MIAFGLIILLAVIIGLPLLVLDDVRRYQTLCPRCSSLQDYKWHDALLTWECTCRECGHVQFKESDQRRILRARRLRQVLAALGRKEVSNAQ